MHASDLLVKIEEKRRIMVELGLAFSFIDERVVRISDQLDKLLNQYQALHVEKQ
ncbi:aspartyl-phosphate phosphatase Spo0E family protein [Lederbergia citrea]|uniref:Aspartyl-phosphate phosphatase Spo0E family protein n=1 Tax=Lederbergia citrea TaxID=2833581 RepID=A0A942Z623_9BACI|nr:aspartyl-phosphate phosphatase Spo0E family protein [Lederbergia citrea]MBS4179102.1 aspartyl-phosphate phosphatase Spo0E family protein [Lederbergia citrea]MBS4205762.1 aspartyl-phosphate phosphatase Spo0E family protein [Lederbergia citrea]MBS4223902.1 aspartyl-phosphate phosphatase Spo0E family protein [Lederbergia citrea]